MWAVCKNKLMSNCKSCVLMCKMNNAVNATVGQCGALIVWANGLPAAKISRPLKCGLVAKAPAQPVDECSVFLMSVILLRENHLKYHLSHQFLFFTPISSIKIILANKLLDLAPYIITNKNCYIGFGGDGEKEHTTIYFV